MEARDAVRNLRELSERDRVLLWDLDGTLIDSGRDLATAINAMLREYGYVAIPESVVIGHIGKGARNLVARCLEEHGHALPSTTEHDAALEAFEAHYVKVMLQETRLYPGVREIVVRLAEGGRKMAVVSNKPEGFCRRILDQLDLSACFEAIVGDGTLPAKKPDPAPVLHAIKRADGGADRSRAVLIGDSYIDIEAARNAKILSCGVAWGLADPVATRAAGPDYWVETVAELSSSLLSDS